MVSYTFFKNKAKKKIHYFIIRIKNSNIKHSCLVPDFLCSTLLLHLLFYHQCGKPEVKGSCFLFSILLLWQDALGLILSCFFTPATSFKDYCQVTLLRVYLSPRDAWYG